VQTQGGPTEKTEEFYLRNAMGQELGIVELADDAWHWYSAGRERLARIIPFPDQQPSAQTVPSTATYPNFDYITNLTLTNIQYYVNDHLGNTRLLYEPSVTCKIGSNPELIEYYAFAVYDYYPYGKVLRKFEEGQERYLSTQHERDRVTGLDYRGARYYDSDLGRFLSLDPLGFQAPGWTPYRAFYDNPLLYTDPDGRLESTIVEENSDGTYQVIGGSRDDGDNGIYIYDPNSKSKKGQLIGYSATPESFYFSERGTWHGTIDPRDQSGRNFLNDEIIDVNPSITGYMAKAKGGEELDFKRRGTTGPKDSNYDNPEFHYRGMPLLGKHDGMQIYASARDVGNIAAGFVAGKEGLGWSTARLGFDGLESFDNGSFTSESTSTQYAQKLGHNIGSSLFQKFELGRTPSSGELRHQKVRSKIIGLGGL
jgi:RHS repeat-associated protein